MKEHENSLTPEALNRQTERWSGEFSLEERRLIQDMYASSQAYSQENQHSLERIWSRFVQKQEEPVFLQENRLKEPGGKQLFIEEKTMQKNEISQEIPFSMLNSPIVTRPRHSLWHTLSIGVAAAVVLLTILSGALLFYGQQHSTANSRPTTKTGATQKDLSSGALVCSFSDNANGYPVPIQPTLDWSSHGQLAVTYHNLETASAQSCTPKSANLQPQAQQATWSPDGTRLLVLSGTYKAEVLDASTGRIIASFPGNGPGAAIDQSAWLSNGTIVSAVERATTKSGDFAQSGTASPIRMQVWDANTGALIRTAITFDAGKQLLGLDVGMFPISPNGKYVAVRKANSDVEIWDIDSGKLVNSLPYHHLTDLVSVSALAWSPDGAFLALGLPNAAEVQIWSIATGHLAASFTDSDTWAQVIGALAWSPNGRYLAESASAIHIWDVKAQKIVASFGRVNKPLFIPALAWSPDSTMLASTVNSAAKTGQKALLQNTVHVWKLS
ncbi:MAG: hypothetical protein M3Z08_23135 [Chloroflexota bacterium]|nr:hypothetical protein [Chloroflexota bacterium]